MMDFRAIVSRVHIANHNLHTSEAVEEAAKIASIAG